VDFDRFTEEALMVLWFTRQAVGDTGGDAITPDHVFLGVLRFQPDLVGRFLEPSDSTEQLTSETLQKIKTGRTVQVTDDVPLAPETDRLLERAIAEE
jgi:hypothetical protein